MKSSEISLTVPLTINSLSTSNNILNPTTDNIPQGNTNNYAVYTIPISENSGFTITNPSTGQFLYYNVSQWINQNISEVNLSNLTSDLLSCENTSNKNSANGYCSLDQNKLLPNSNIPQLSFSNLTNIFNIVSPANNSVGLLENTLINSSFLSDFNISSASSNQILQYSNGKWTNATLNFTSTLSGDSDVSLNNLSNGQVLQFNGSKWINTTLIMGSTTLSSDSDVSLSSLSNGQLLQYNLLSSKWINISPTYISSCSINACTDATLTSFATNNYIMGRNGVTQPCH